jgi:hypothetical protein
MPLKLKASHPALRHMKVAKQKKTKNKTKKEHLKTVTS